MTDRYKPVQWVVQSNLTHADDLRLLKSACNDLEVRCVEVFVIPFTTELPLFDRSRPGIFYGSVTFNNLVYKDPQLKDGLFFNSESFPIQNYFDKWGSYMLNYGAAISSFHELMQQVYPADALLFIRPDDDSKSFSGEVKRFDEIQSWYNQLKMFDNTGLSLDSKIVISQPYNLQYEWRLWIVDKKVVGASKYRNYFKLSKEEGCPPEVIAFAEARCLEYTPHDVFVMDICLCGDACYIVECGCMNSAGFYKADIPAIVRSVTDYFAGKLDD